ncbi:MAG TPA: MarR family transcriptional regulator [Chthoniobacterales bacterium]|nr:MarR family transcriptional regulator [Chthoniobacterales bacterium]
MQQVDTQKIGLILVETARAWRTKLDQRLRPLGLSQGKWTTLVHLAWGGDKLTQRELAGRIGIEEATLAGLLDRLQRDRWIQRKTSEHDRRCKTVHLQPRSKKVLAKIFETAQALRQELISDIPPADLEICMNVLARIRDKADAVSQDAIIRKVNGTRNQLNGIAVKGVGARAPGKRTHR